MKKVLSLLINISLLFSLTACGNNATADMIENTTLSSNVVSEKDLGSQGMEQSERQQQTEDSDMNNTTILVAYFSRTGENYNVGNIEKGNTHIVADMIAEQTGGDTFEISTVTPYPDNYDECTDIARQEQNENAHPELAAFVENMGNYDTIFLGYPIWWSDVPMAVYTFLESYDFSVKNHYSFLYSRRQRTCINGKQYCSSLPRFKDYGRPFY